MISLRDALHLHWRKLRRRSLFRTGRQILLLFLSFLVVLVALNVGWGALRLGLRSTRDAVYPPDGLLVVERKKAWESIRQADVRRIAAVEGVAAVQEHLFSSSQHYFDLGEVRYPVPTSILGYRPEIFRLHDVLDARRHDLSAIPLLLSEDLLALRHDAASHRFLRAGAGERERLLGTVFSVWIDPLLGREPLISSWQNDTAILENPAARRAQMRDLHERALKAILREQPGKLRYLVPLEVRVQVVGFARERLYAGDSLRGYGIVPLEVAQRLREFVQLRRNTLSPPHAPEDPTSLYVVVEPGKQGEVAERIRALGFDALDREGLNRKRTNWLEGLIHDVKRDPRGFVVVSSLALGLWTLLLYLAVSSVTKDSVAEIGVLRALGARRRDLVKIYLVAGAVEVARAFAMALAAANALLLAAGFFTARLATTIPAASIDAGVFTGQVLRLGNIPATWLLAPLWAQLLPLALFAPLTLLAAWLPVRKASRVDPVTAIAG